MFTFSTPFTIEAVSKWRRLVTNDKQLQSSIAAHFCVFNWTRSKQRIARNRNLTSIDRSDIWMCSSKRSVRCARQLVCKRVFWCAPFLSAWKTKGTILTTNVDTRNLVRVILSNLSICSHPLRLACIPTLPFDCTLCLRTCRLLRRLLCLHVQPFVERLRPNHRSIVAFHSPVSFRYIRSIETRKENLDGRVHHYHNHRNHCRSSVIITASARQHLSSTTSRIISFTFQTIFVSGHVWSFLTTSSTRSIQTSRSRWVFPIIRRIKARPTVIWPIRPISRDFPTVFHRTSKKSHKMVMQHYFKWHFLINSYFDVILIGFCWNNLPISVNSMQKMVNQLGTSADNEQMRLMLYVYQAFLLFYVVLTWFWCIYSN